MAALAEASARKTIPIFIRDDDPGLPMDSVLIPQCYEGMIDSVMIPHGLIIGTCDRRDRRILL